MKNAIRVVERWARMRGFSIEGVSGLTRMTMLDRASARAPRVAVVTGGNEGMLINLYVEEHLALRVKLFASTAEAWTIAAALAMAVQGRANRRAWARWARRPARQA